MYDPQLARAICGEGRISGLMVIKSSRVHLRGVHLVDDPGLVVAHLRGAFAATDSFRWLIPSQPRRKKQCWIVVHWRRLTLRLRLKCSRRIVRRGRQGFETESSFVSRESTAREKLLC
jgi:hypothetical protein